MFNSNDFEMVKITKDTVPDGVIDTTEHYLDMVQITDILAKIDYEDEISRMHGMMEIMNCIYDEEENLVPEKVSGILIALSFHIINIVSNMEIESRSDYFNFIKTEVLTDIEKDSASLPYWNFGGDDE